MSYLLALVWDLVLLPSSVAKAVVALLAFLFFLFFFGNVHVNEVLFVENHITRAEGDLLLFFV